MFLKFVPLIFKNILRKKLRSFLTIASIILPLFIICMMGTLLTALDENPLGEKGAFRLIVHHKVSLINHIPEAFGEKIRQLEGVEEMVAMNWFGGQYIDSNSKNMFARFALDADKFFNVFDDFEVIEGSEEDWINDRTGAIVGASLMRKYGWKLGQKIPLKGDIFPGNYIFTIQAVFTGPSDAAMMFHRTYIEETLPKTKGRVMSFRVRASSSEAVARLSKEIDTMFENTSYPTKSESEKEFINGFVSMLGNIKLLISSLCTIIAAVILLIAANAMAMSARERVVEIAVLRTLGFQKSTIMGLILGEGLVLSMIGGLIGMGLFLVTLAPFREALVTSPMGGLAASMRIYPSIMLLGLGICVGVGVFASLVPAIRSSMRTIPDGLRQVV